MPGRKWTKKDDELLRELYQSSTAKELAKRFKRSPSAVHQRARLLGAHEAIDRVAMAARDTKIRDLHSKGWTGSEIGKAVGMHTRSVNARINRLGLTPNGRNERYRKRVAKATRIQCKKAGVKNLGQLRSQRIQQFVAEIGWPGLSIRAAQIAELLHQKGPMTRRQICEAAGIPWKGSRSSMKNKRVPGGCYMAELQRAGVVVRLRAAITGRGKGNRQDLYMIGLEVEKCAT